MTMRQLLNEGDFLRTADLSLAAAILLFHPLEGIDRKDDRRSDFIFKRTSELDGLIERYWRREMRIDPKAYFDALRAIKARLYDR